MIPWQWRADAGIRENTNVTALLREAGLGIFFKMKKLEVREDNLPKEPEVEDD